MDKKDNTNNTNIDLKAELLVAFKKAAPHVAQGAKELALIALTIAARTAKYVAEQVVEVLEEKK